LTALAERVLGSPRLYDWVQRIVGFEELRRRVANVLERLEPGTLLDVGAGTGGFFPVVPPEFGYIALDVDDRKLARIRERFPEVRTVAGSGTALPFADDAVDYSLCINVSHHLSDRDLERLVSELGRVTRRTLVFVDALRARRIASSVLWSLDRGSHPRSLEVIRAALETRFSLDVFESFTIRHAYLMTTAVPRGGVKNP
jgi:SAM-dependent methyltransferase